MDIQKSKEKKFESVKKLLRSLTLSRKKHSTPPPLTEVLLPQKSKSCSHATTAEKGKHVVTPRGCFSVYVGFEKQRFVLKMKYLSHPLFKMLLKEAELEYGFSNDGPIMLPCDVDHFHKVLTEMDCSINGIQSRNIGLFGYGNRSPFSFNPTRRLGNSFKAEDYASYRRLN